MGRQEPRPIPGHRPHGQLHSHMVGPDHPEGVQHGGGRPSHGAGACEAQLVGLVQDYHRRCYCLGLLRGCWTLRLDLASSIYDYRRREFTDFGWQSDDFVRFIVEPIRVVIFDFAS